MPGRCVAGGCSAFPDVEMGLVLHAIPSYNDDRPEAKKRRKKWVDFVMVNKIDRPNTTPSFVPFVSLPFIFRSFGLLVASLLFVKGIERIVLLGEN